MSATSRRHRRPAGSYKIGEALRQAASQPAFSVGNAGPYEMVQQGEVMFMVARQLPGMAPELADAIRLRRDATIAGECPGCGARRHSGRPRPGHKADAYFVHDEQCPAHDRAIGRPGGVHRLEGGQVMQIFCEHAVALAANGWPVFPLAPRSKVPLVAGGHGHLDGSTDPDVAERTWRKHPHANIGARVPDSLVCIDLDPRNGAVDTLAALVKTYGRLPATLTSLTGSGGAHMFYARPAGELTQRSNLLGAGIDVKVGGRGYVVLPPSIHPNGRRYAWAADLERQEREGGRPTPQFGPGAPPLEW